jgi:putative endopeptidase
MSTIESNPQHPQHPQHHQEEEKVTSESASCKENFYLHVNKKWLDDPANAIPSEYSRWGGFIKLCDEGLINQIQLVKDLRSKLSKNDDESKISAIWEASCDRFQNWKNDTANCDPISRELEILDAYFSVQTPINNDTERSTRLAEYFYYTQINGIGNVFDIDTGSDLENANNVVLDFSTTGLSLPNREYYTDSNFADKCTMFKEHIQNVMNIINSKSSVHLDDNFVQNVFEFEQQLAQYKMKSEQARRYDEYYTNTTLTDLHKKIDELASLPDKCDNYSDEENKFQLTSLQKESIKIFLEKVYELFDLRRVLEENRERSFIKNGIENPPHNEQIVAYDGDSIRRVFALILNESTFNKYRAFLQYKVICSFKGFCTKDLDDEFFDFYSRKLNGQLEQKPEDKRSIQLVNAYADEMMGKVFVEKYFPETYKTDIRCSILEILDVMKESIKKNDWLTEQTKIKALEKLSKFNIKVGYPDVWKDYSEFDVKDGDTLYDISKKAKKWALKVDFYDKLNTILDRNEWLMSPQTVNAYFMPTQNEIVFPAAILQPPFYCKSNAEIDFDITDEINEVGPNYDFTVASNFGGIGAVIAHEITHGYDDKGRKFDGDGNLNDWWTEEDACLFKTKVDIMAQQAEQYKFVDHEDSDKEYKLNSQLTMGENLADLGGISLALQALNRCLLKQNAAGNVVRANKRVLLKSFANIWKQNTKKDCLINQLTTDPHSPSEFRANIIKNMDEFYDVFNIEESDGMYIPPNKRVRMW